MNPRTDAKLDTFGLLQTLIQVSHGSKNSQTSADSPLCVIFMGVGIAEVHEEPVTEQLGNVSVKALDDFSTHLLIRPYHVTPVFRVELAGKFGGIDQVAEHHRELTAFGFWRTRFGWRSFNRSSLVFSPDFLLSRLNDGGLRSRACFTSPDQHSSVLVLGNVLDVDEFLLEQVKAVIV
jgi:hypothetical protein